MLLLLYYALLLLTLKACISAVKTVHFTRHKILSVNCSLFLSKSHNQKHITNIPQLASSSSMISSLPVRGQSYCLSHTHSAMIHVPSSHVNWPLVQFAVDQRTKPHMLFHDGFGGELRGGWQGRQRETDRQTDRQTDRERETETEREGGRE